MLHNNPLARTGGRSALAVLFILALGFNTIGTALAVDVCDYDFYWDHPTTGERWVSDDSDDWIQEEGDDPTFWTDFDVEPFNFMAVTCNDMSAYENTYTDADGTTWYSNDGEAWVTSWGSTTTWAELGNGAEWSEFGNDFQHTWTAEDGTTWYSNDLETWFSADGGEMSWEELGGGLVWSEDGGEYQWRDGDGTLWTSLDGETWTSEDGETSSWTELLGVWQARSPYIYTDENGVVWTSTDGETWTSDRTVTETMTWEDLGVDTVLQPLTCKDAGYKWSCRNGISYLSETGKTWYAANGVGAGKTWSELEACADLGSDSISTSGSTSGSGKTVNCFEDWELGLLIPGLLAAGFLLGLLTACLCMRLCTPKPKPPTLVPTTEFVYPTQPQKSVVYYQEPPQQQYVTEWVTEEVPMPEPTVMVSQPVQMVTVPVQQPQMEMVTVPSTQQVPISVRPPAMQYR